MTFATWSTWWNARIACRLSGEGILNCHASLQPRPDATVRNAEISCPFRKRLRDTLIGDGVIVALVVRLLNPVSPATVFWCVWPVVVDALNGMIWRRARPHVGVEVLERVEPTVAHEDAASTVAWIGWNVRIGATRLDMRPTAILRRADHAVRGICGACRITHKATTTARVTASEMTTGRNNLGSAVANTAPCSAAGSIAVRVCQHKEPGIPLPPNVFDLSAGKWRCINYVHARHDNIFGKAWQARSAA